MPAAKQQFPFGDGELSTILLAKELAADRVLLDDYGARKLARAEGLKVAGSVGILEESFRRGHLADLRAAFQQLITHHVYIDHAGCWRGVCDLWAFRRSSHHPACETPMKSALLQRKQ